MLPIFILLAGIALGILWDPEWSTPYFDPRATLLALPGLLLFQLAASRLVVLLESRHRAGRPWHEHVAWLLRCSAAYRALALALYASLVWNFNWPWFVSHTLGLGGVPVVGLLALVAPLVLLVLASFAGLNRIESAARGTRLPLGPYLSFQARMGLILPLIPALSVLSLFDVIQAVTPLRRAFAIAPFLSWLLLLGIAVTLVAAAPSFLARVWGAFAMPEGPTLDRLRDLCDAAGVPRPRFLVWPTRGFGHINAAVVGILPRTRVVLFTDEMLARFSPEELAAVLAHELGHIRHRHLQVYFLLALSLAFFVTFADDAFATVASEGARAGVSLVAVALAGGAGFGFLSRRFERQADLFAARTVDATSFVAALEKVAELSGDVRKVWFFTHMSIEERVNHILEAFSRPESAARFERRLRSLVLAGVAFAAVSLGGALIVIARQITRAPVRRAEVLAEEDAHEARRLWSNGDRAAGIERAARAAGRDPGQALLYAEMLFSGDRALEAREPYERARAVYPDGSEERVLIDERLQLIEGMEQRARRRTAEDDKIR
ncbi:MAG: M48 family metalloprotease [Candidatus Brocadiae bacterium]|nr:M48 family metalloprotease [Candidatus Brocadiia bacterium]